LDNNLVQKIQLEIDQIDELLSEASPLFDICKIREPDFVERCGIAMIIHSFYNGVENILLLIMKSTDSISYNGITWHKELFSDSFKKTEHRTEILNEELRIPLHDYLQFRHFVRHTYGFQLKWDKMKNLLFDMNAVWADVKVSLEKFVEDN
jgi:hypothetical protein